MSKRIDNLETFLFNFLTRQDYTIYNSIDKKVSRKEFCKNILDTGLKNNIVFKKELVDWIKTLKLKEYLDQFKNDLTKEEVLYLLNNLLYDLKNIINNQK